MIVSEFGHRRVCRNQSWFTHFDGFVQQFEVSVFWFPWKTIFINRSIIVITSGDKTSGGVFKICSSVKLKPENERKRGQVQICEGV